MTSSFDTRHAFRAVPLLCSFVAFILVMLALFAGNKPGVLEGYHIITDNSLGDKTNLDTLPSPPPNPGRKGAGQGTVTANTDNGIMDDGEDNGPRDTFYTLYALAICEGGLTPDHGRQLTQCYPYFSSSDEIFTIPALLGTPDTTTTTHFPHNSTARTHSTSTPLTSTGLTYQLSAALDGLDTLFKAVGVLLSIGAGFTGLSLFACLPSLAVSSETYSHSELAYDWAVWTNLTFASAAVLFLLLGALVAAAGAKDAEVRINRLGEEVGVTAVMGLNWIALTWAVVGLMTVVLVYWAVRGGCLRRADKKGVKRQQKQQPRDVEAAREEPPGRRGDEKEASVSSGRSRPARPEPPSRLELPPSSTQPPGKGKEPETYAPTSATTRPPPETPRRADR
ncbi:predicted protein [Chaetomium globosum CBS 148.51]|uniref:Uncharacterized protein n=1 Tax=Chaetomium globosum (strain ATCC 6205 / CBS 148.51 / DSM 1962 / NBRC 6347 / NRRL 1970) TaxID=306901 RepID=Q2HER2_CHAGB|nr:uncharacterized protein CHGG_01292 [Chaetomium globosum CBS 148.51]EAQ93057.1 predicted protein [Chaetomium globosum CBS 148.51]